VTGPVVLVVNPTKVDDFAQLQATVSEQCARRGLPEPVVLETTESDTGAGAAHDAVRRGAQLVLVAGGDGTVQAVCGGLAGSGVVLGILPLGTGNLLARNLDLPLELDPALAVALGGRERRLDLATASIGDRDPVHFAVMAGVGFDAEMMVDAPAGLAGVRRVGSAAPAGPAIAADHRLRWPVPEAVHGSRRRHRQRGGAAGGRRAATRRRTR